MKPVIKELFSPDVWDLEKYFKEEGESFRFLLQMMVGSSESEGKDSFDILICSPQWLCENIKDQIIIGRHHLIMKRFEYNEVFNFLKNIVSDCEAPTWDECANKMGRIGMWEFEDYRELPPRKK